MLDVTKAHPLRPTTLAHRVSNIRLSTLHRISEPACRRRSNRAPNHEATTAAKAGVEGLVRRAASIPGLYASASIAPPQRSVPSQTPP